MADGQLGRVLGHIRKLVGGRPAEAGSDAQLLERFIALREEAAFAELVQRHGPMVRAVCQRVLQHDHNADDAFQATFLVLARKAGTIRNNNSVGSWLYGTAYRLAQKIRVGAARRQSRHSSLLAGSSPEAAVYQQATTDSERLEIRAVLDEELNRLPEKYRAPLILCYLEGRTNEEAAAHLNWTKGTVSGRLARARDLLRNRLARRGVALPAAALGTLLGEQLAAAALPASLTQATIQSALLFAGGQSAMAGGATEASIFFAKGVIKTMWMNKLKVTAILVLALATLAGGAGALVYRPRAEAVPVPEKEAKVDEKGKTDPPGVPLELKLVAKKDTYTLDLGGKTPAEFKKLIDDFRKKLETPQSANPATLPAPPEVDIVLELRNTGDKELRLDVSGLANVPLARAVLDLNLAGPGAISSPPPKYVQAVPPRDDIVALAPGKVLSYPVKALQSGYFNGVRSYWMEPGEYTLTAQFHTSVSPVPEGAKEAFKGYGRVTLTSNPVKLKVIDGKADARTDPPSVPLELKLSAKRDTYTLDLGGKTPAEVKKQIEEFKKAVEAKRSPDPTTLPLPPEVDLTLQIRNTGEKEVTFAGGYELELEGPGSISTPGLGRPATEKPYELRQTTLGSGKSLTAPLSRLLSANASGTAGAYWTQAGEYTLRVRCGTAISNAVTLKVVDGQGKPRTEPPGVPVELKLVAKKDTYTLNLGGKTPAELKKQIEEFKKRVAGNQPVDPATLPPLPEVDLVLEVRNTGDKELRLDMSGLELEGHRATHATVGLELAGPGAISTPITAQYAAIRAREKIMALAPGQRLAYPLKALQYGYFNFTRAYWTQAGDYTLTAKFYTSVSPVPKGAEELRGIFEGFGRVTLISNPVTLKVVANP